MIQSKFQLSLSSTVFFFFYSMSEMTMTFHEIFSLFFCVFFEISPNSECEQIETNNNKI